jgi:hypothetical protein
MARREAKSAHPVAPVAPREVILMLSSALGLAIAVACGALLSRAGPPQSPWLFTLSFTAPAVVALAVFWLARRRL